MHMDIVQEYTRGKNEVHFPLARMVTVSAAAPVAFLTSTMPGTSWLLMHPDFDTITWAVK